MAAFPTRSQEGGIEGCEMNRGWVSTSDLALPVDHERQAERVSTEQLTTGPRCVSPCLKTLEAVSTRYIDKKLSIELARVRHERSDWAIYGLGYTAHLWSLWWGEGISELWFRPVFRPTTWEFSILIFYLFVTFTVPRQTVKLGVELLPSLLWWDV